MLAGKVGAEAGIVTQFVVGKCQKLRNDGTNRWVRSGTSTFLASSIAQTDVGYCLQFWRIVWQVRLSLFDVFHSLQLLA